MALETLGSKNVGSTVRIKVNGTLRDFIVVYQGRPSALYDASCDGVWLLMKDIYTTREWHSSNVNDYAKSTVHSYLNSSFLNDIDAKIREKVKQVKIPYRPGSGTSQSVNSGANGLSTKAFLLSAREAGYTQENVDQVGKYIVNDGSLLSYFREGGGSLGTADGDLRIAKYNGSAEHWSLRTPFTASEKTVWMVRSIGDGASNICYTLCGIRPALILPPDLLVSYDNSVTVNTAPTVPGSITVPQSIKGGEAVTVSWSASTDAEDNLEGYAVERSVDGGTTWSQIYQGSGLSTTSAVPYGSASAMYRVRAYDGEGLYSGYRTSQSVKVTNNTAPATPGSISIPGSIHGGASIEVSWSASTDAENNLDGYSLERSTNGGGTWTQVYQGSATKAKNTVPAGSETVMYRVRAYDSEGLYSGYRNSSQVTVINNRAPAAPAGITVPETVLGGGTLEVSWSASSDADGNLSGYELERQADGGSWTRIYKGAGTSCTDTVERGWSSVNYRVRAYDAYNAYSGYTTGTARAVDNNRAPAIVCGHASGTDLGTKNEGFSITYSVGDEDGGPVDVTETADGAEVRTFSAGAGDENSFDVTGDLFFKLLNGAHILTITASDGLAAAVHKLTFTKEVTEASVTLKEPFAADGKITICVLSVHGSIPADAEFTVEVTNNAKDDAPVWEDATHEVRSGGNHIFENQTAARGFAFNFRVKVKRGPSGQGGYINSVQGGFQ